MHSKYQILSRVPQFVNVKCSRDVKAYLWRVHQADAWRDEMRHLISVFHFAEALGKSGRTWRIWWVSKDLISTARESVLFKELGDACVAASDYIIIILLSFGFDSSFFSSEIMDAKCEHKRKNRNYYTFVGSKPIKMNLCSCKPETNISARYRVINSYQKMTFLISDSCDFRIKKDRNLLCLSKD